MQEPIPNKTPTKKPAQSRRRLSFWRVLLAIIILTSLAAGSVYGWKFWQVQKAAAAIRPWFAAYVDVTSKPTYPFEQLGASEYSSVVLSFIVSSKENPCTPTWGTYHTLEEARGALDLDRRIARLQQQEGRVAISFGGAINHELALHCVDHDQLVTAYNAVIDRYNIDTIDLDLENTSLTDSQASERRAKAIAQIQQDRRQNGKSLAVWLTLPVAPYGMTPEGTSTVAQMLANGVDLAGVNVMTMNYGESKEGADMLEASKRALIETHRQLDVLYKQAGINLSGSTIWRKVGATPMLGQNDVLDEIFTYQDAVGLNEFGQVRGIGRMSMWSANRDLPCGENYVDTRLVSDSCSGVHDPKFAFIQALSKNFDGDLTQNSTLVTKADALPPGLIVDDPETSPYQIWQEKGAYLKGTKVVWRGNVYEAKWWTKSDIPDNPVLQSWETPWQLIGPVLPGEKPVPQATLPLSTYEEWAGQTEYLVGQRVLFEGVPYQAKWWNQGESPAAATANLDSSPWVPLTNEEVELILAELATVAPASSPSASKKITPRNAVFKTTESTVEQGSSPSVDEAPARSDDLQNTNE